MSRNGAKGLGGALAGQAAAAACKPWRENVWLDLDAIRDQLRGAQTEPVTAPSRPPGRAG